MTFKHGISKATSDAGARPVIVKPTSTIVIVGTAPDADAAVFPLDTPILIAGSPTKLAKLDTSANSDRNGTLLRHGEIIFDQKRTVLVVIRVDEGIDSAATKANVIGAVDGQGKRSGIKAINDVQALLGYKPRILIAPGFTDDQPVLTALIAVGGPMRAFSYGDCLGVQASEAWAYKANFDSKHLELCWPPQVNTIGEVVCLSAVRAGIEAKKDQIKGQEYSASASNRVVNGIVGGLYPVDYRDDDQSCDAYLLNLNQVTTCINDDGYRLWGNRNTSSDTKWQFSAHVKVNDVILDNIAESLKWARDRKIIKTFVEDVTETVNNFLAKETKANNLLGGSAWADPELNTPDVVLAGEFYMDYDFTPPGIAESITVTSHYVNDYATAIFK